MKKFFVVLFMGICFAAIVNTASVVAQENDEDKFSFGKIVSVAADQILVKEYDFAKDADVEATYYLSSETELGNINAVTDLVAGDDVVLDYTEKDGKRTVMTLVKEEQGGEANALMNDGAVEEVPMAEVPVEEVPVVEVPAVEVPLVEVPLENVEQQ